MSATLYFTNHNTQENVRPWQCQCVRQLSNDPIDREFGWLEDCGCPDRDCNMSNTNARAVLSALGLNNDFENADAMLPQELWAACNRFLASDLPAFVDSGLPVRQLSSNVVDLGRRPDYITERAEQIRDLCAQAMLAGATRCYFC